MVVALRPADTLKCNVANGTQCAVSEVCDLPMVLEGRLRVLEVLVVPQLPLLLILGWDFLESVGVVPVIHEWYFSSEPSLVSAVDLGRTTSDLLNLDKSRLQAVVEGNVALMGQSLGCTRLTKPVIVTESPPIKQRYYRVSPVNQAIIDKEIDKMLEQGIIEHSPWASPLIMVKKKDGSPYVDFRKLNSVTNHQAR